MATSVKTLISSSYPIGYTGSAGSIGYTGSASTVVGYTGSQGSIGTTGYTGSRGDTGATGYTGSAANILNNIINFSEVITPLTGATGVVTHDFSLSEVFYHTSAAANFTANITNVPTTNNAAIGVTIIVVQGATPYYPNALQIDSSAQSILWQGGSAPAANANKTDVYEFSLIRVSSSWVVLGSGKSHG